MSPALADTPAPTRRKLAFASLLGGATLAAFLTLTPVLLASAARAGAPIVTPVEGFDPRALLTGHYAQLRFPFSTFEALPASETSGLRPGEPVWARLEETLVGWRIAGLSPVRTGQGLEAKGVLENTYTDPDTQTAGGSIRFGVERYYAQQAEAEALEARLRETDAAPVEVELRLAADGQLHIRALIVDGETRPLTWW